MWMEFGKKFYILYKEESMMFIHCMAPVTSLPKYRLLEREDF
jgi:hypothetical protein